MKLLEIDQSIERYLSAVEAGMTKTPAEAHQQRDEKAADLIENLKEIEPHIEQLQRKEIDFLHAHLDELRLQYALGKMEAGDKLHELKESIDHGIRKIKDALHKSKKLATKDKQIINKKLHNAWVALKVEMNLLELHFDLAKENTESKLSAATKDVRDDLRLIARYAKEELESQKLHASEWIKKTKKSVSQRTHRFVEAMEHYFLDGE